MPNSNKKKLFLKDYSYNVYSQNGEDGIIEELIKKLSIDNQLKKWCVEFGAWDGIHLSNTFNLIIKGWNSVYIEGDKNRFQDLLNTAKKHPKIIPLNNFISIEKNDENNLDNLLQKTNLPKDFEILSIDIDSYDLEVWDSLVFYKPKVVIIEINSSYPPGIIKWHSGANKNTNGNSFSATLNVAKNKGYGLVCHTGNMIFIRNELLESLDIESKYLKYPELLYDEKWLILEKENFIFKLFRRLKAFFKYKIISKL